MKVVVWLAAIAVGVGLYETVGEAFRDHAAKGACTRHAVKMDWALSEWDGPGYHTRKMPGHCVFVDPRSGGTIRIDDERVDRGGAYHRWVLAGTVLSVAGIALTLVVGNSLTGALD